MCVYISSKSCVECVLMYSLICILCRPQDEPSEEPGEGESVEGEAVVCVKGGAGDPSDLEGGDPSVHVPEDTTVLDLNTESRPPDSEGGETVKESDGSPDEVGGKRGRRRQKFKPAAS